MRLAFLAALATTTSLATPAAEACGGDFNRAPAMYLVANHHGRSFVLLGGSVPKDAKLDWKGETMSYDWTKISTAPALASAMQMTLVGGTRTRLLATRNQVFIQPIFETRDEMTALEIFPPREAELRIAIEGKHEATWGEIQQVPVGLETIAWAQNPGFTPPLDSQLIHVSKIVGTDVELITAWGEHGATTYVRTPGARPWGGYAGTPQGIVTVDGVRYAVLVNNGRINPVRV